MMSIKNVGLVCLALAFVAAVTTVSAGGHGKGGHHGMWQNLTCKGEKIKMEGMGQYKKECINEIAPMPSTTEASGTTDEDRKKKWKAFGELMKKHGMCIAVCEMKKQGMLNADGTYNGDGAKTIIDAKFPASVQDDMKKAFDTCGSTHGKEFSMDNNCEGYKKFKHCTHEKSVEVCDMKAQIDEMKKKWKESHKGEKEPAASAEEA